MFNDIFCNNILARMKKESKISVFYKKHHDAIIAILILTPMILWWIVACGYPLVYGVFLGFFELYDVTQDPVFIGFQNFQNFFTDTSYLRELWNTIWIGFASTILINLAGLLVAVALNSVKHLKGFYRSIWYIPAITSSVAITQIFGIIFDPFTGIVNQILASNGMDTVSLDSNYGLAIAVILLYSVWKSAGSSAIVWLAGLQSIDKKLYEAAALDGANKWTIFKRVTLPSLKPISIYIIITGIIGAFQIYEPVAFITNGGPYDLTNVLTLRIIRDGFYDFNIGMSGASSLILAIIIVASTLTYYRTTKVDSVKNEKRERLLMEKRRAKFNKEQICK